MAADNILVKNLGLHPTPNFNFMLRVEALFDLPCKAVRAFTKANEFEYIQEGGLNDYVHMRRKPISQPFTFEVDRYVGVDYWDPLPLGAEPILPICLLVFGGAAYRSNGTTTFLRMYTFTGCTIMEKTYGELNAEQSGLYVETTKISYKECVIVTNPSIYDLGGKQTTYEEDLELDTKTNLYMPKSDGKYYARRVPGDIAGTTIYKNKDGKADSANDNLNRGRYDVASGSTFDPKNFTKDAMNTAKFALTPPNDDVMAERHIYDAETDTHYANRPADYWADEPEAKEMNRGRYDAGAGGTFSPKDFTKEIMRTAKYASLSPKDSERAPRRIYDEKTDTHYAHRPTDYINKTPKGEAMNKGRYDTEAGGKFSIEDFTEQIMRNGKLRYASTPAADGERAERHLYDAKTDTHYASRVSDIMTTTPEGKMMNRGRYDTKGGSAFDPKAFSKETMGTTGFAAEGSASAPKAKSIRYTEGDPSTMSHIDAATYLNKR